MNPIKEAQEALVVVDKLLTDLGGLRSYLSIMAATETPKGYTPVKIEVQAPFFQETTHKGQEALKATVVIEIMCLKD